MHRARSAAAAASTRCRVHPARHMVEAVSMQHHIIARARACVCACTHTRTHAHTRTRTLARARHTPHTGAARAHTRVTRHTHTHTQPLMKKPFWVFLLFRASVLCFAFWVPRLRRRWWWCSRKRNVMQCNAMQCSLVLQGLKPTRAWV